MRKNIHTPKQHMSLISTGSLTLDGRLNANTCTTSMEQHVQQKYPENLGEIEVVNYGIEYR